MSSCPKISPNAMGDISCANLSWSVQGDCSSVRIWWAQLNSPSSGPAPPSLLHIFFLFVHPHPLPLCMPGLPVLWASVALLSHVGRRTSSLHCCKHFKVLLQQPALVECMFWWCRPWRGLSREALYQYSTPAFKSFQSHNLIL